MGGAVGRQMEVLGGPGLPVLLHIEGGVGCVNGANEGNGMLIGSGPEQFIIQI